MMPGPGTAHSTGGTPVFTDIQGKWGADFSSGTTVNVTLTSNPATGNAVLCHVTIFPESVTVTVQDGNGNAYTQTPNSPSNVQISAEAVFIFYLLNAPANANAVITGTVSGGPITFHSAIGCEEFHRTSGTWTFDTDVAGNAASGATVNTPSITTAVAGELVFGAVYAQSGFNANPSNSPWSDPLMGLSTSTNNSSSMILSSSGSSTPMNMTIINGAGSWNSMIAALK